METVHGNLSHAMRDNYNEHGVDEVCLFYFSPYLLIVNKQLVALLAYIPSKSARNYTDFIVVLSKSGSNISQPFLSWYQKSECKPKSS